MTAIEDIAALRRALRRAQQEMERAGRYLRSGRPESALRVVTFGVGDAKEALALQARNGSRRAATPRSM